MVDGSATRLGIVTGNAAPELIENGKSLAAELQKRGFSVSPVVWSDTDVQWDDFDSVLIRSCWEYHTEPVAFREWLRTIDNLGIDVQNPIDVIRWNIHKFYLRDLAENGVSILPTVWVERGSDTDLQTIIQSEGWRDAVVKPAIGTSSSNVWRTSPANAPNEQEKFDRLLSTNDVLIQEYAPEITDGERSLIFFGGRFSHATRSVPATGDFRAHPNYGGSSEQYDPAYKIVEDAAKVLQLACDHLRIDPTDLPYARVDGIERNGQFVLMELELIEPYLSLDTSVGAVATFADTIENSLAGSTSPRGESFPAVSERLRRNAPIGAQNGTQEAK